MNFIIQSRETSYFLGCDDVSDSNGKTGYGIARRIADKISDSDLVDMEDIRLIVTDAASPNLKANEYLQEWYPWLLFSKCVPHQVSHHQLHVPG